MCVIIFLLEIQIRDLREILHHKTIGLGFSELQIALLRLRVQQVANFLAINLFKSMMMMMTNPRL